MKIDWIKKSCCLFLICIFFAKANGQTPATIPASFYDSLKAGNLPPLDKTIKGYFSEKDKHKGVFVTREGYKTKKALDGEVRKYSEYDGRLESVIYYKKNQVNGMKALYRKDGTLSSVEYFTKSVYNGPWKTYRAGVVTGEGYYIDGKKNGIEKTYFGRTGKIYQEGNYVNDEKDGVWKTYDEDGNLVETKIYRNGERQDGQ